MLALELFAVLLLIALNGFFASAEFSLVAVRPARIRQLAEQGNARAAVVMGLQNEMGRVISGVQVGITLTSLGLGFLGEISLARLLLTLLGWLPGRWGHAAAHSLAFGIAFLLLTFLQIVFGELVPKAIGLERAERVALMVAPGFRRFLRSAGWVVDWLDGIAGRFLKVLGLGRPASPGQVRTAEELQVLVRQARERGVLPASEERFIQNALELPEMQARLIMVPRPDVHAVAVEARLEDVLRVVLTTQRSRLPVYRENLDHLVGFVHVKDLLWYLWERLRAVEAGRPAPEFQLSSLVRPILIVPETKSVSELLYELRRRRAGLAMLVDEFGSIQGLVTLEDILEQLVGEIHDEFDIEQRPLQLADGSMIFQGSVNVRDLATQYNIHLPEDPSYETLGGFVLSRLGFLPRGGETFEADGYRFTVLDMNRRRVGRVKITPLRASETSASRSSKAG